MRLMFYVSASFPLVRSQDVAIKNLGIRLSWNEDTLSQISSAVLHHIFIRLLCAQFNDASQSTTI